MINKKIKGLVSGFVFLGVSLSASAFSITGNNSIEDFQEIDWKGASYEEVQLSFASYAAYMKDSRSMDEYRLKEKWLINFFVEAHPGMNDYWNDSYVFERMKVNHADSLIELERNIVGKTHLGARMHTGSAQQSPKISDGTIYPELKTSLSRMRHGMAPIGPDNKPLLLCRLHDDQRASYFEVSENDSWRILNVLGSGMSKTQACLEEDAIPYYWKDRAKNLFNIRENLIRSKRGEIN